MFPYLSSNPVRAARFSTRPASFRASWGVADHRVRGHVRASGFAGAIQTGAWTVVGLFPGGPRARVRLLNAAAVAAAGPQGCGGGGDEMGLSYYDALLPVREPGAGLLGMIASLRAPKRVLASIRVPGGRIVIAFLSDSARLSRMFAANWAPAGTDQEPDATLYALAQPAAATVSTEAGTRRAGGRGIRRQWWSLGSAHTGWLRCACGAFVLLLAGTTCCSCTDARYLSTRGRQAGGGYHRQFRSGEDHAGGRTAATSRVFSGGAERRLGWHFADLWLFGQHRRADAAHEVKQCARPPPRLLLQRTGRLIFA